MFFSLNGIETANFYEFKEWTALNFPLHCHYSLEVVFVRAGNITVEIEKKKYLLSKGDSIAIMPFEKHSFITEKEEFSDVFIFQVSPKLISNWDACFGGKSFENPRCSFSDSKISRLYSELSEAGENLIKLNAAFFGIMNAYLVGNKLIPNSTVNDTCLSALKYISENYKRDITLKDVASDIGVSHVYLSRVFAKKIKFKFVDCINSFRMQEAISLLSIPEKSVSEICYESGFGSMRQFNRFFLKTMSCTPSEYRKRIKN